MYLRFSLKHASLAYGLSLPIMSAAFAQTTPVTLNPVQVDAPQARPTALPSNQTKARAQRTAAARRAPAAAPPGASTSPAAAPEAAGGGPTAPSLGAGGGNQIGLQLRQPSTAGSRLGLTPLETPASVTVISGDKIRAQGDKTIADAESRAVGVTSVPFSGTGNNALSARGFYGTNSINQLYDGKQLFNGGGVIAFPIDPWNVDRIEILGGSSSVLYGTGGVGGAFNVIPKAPDPAKTSIAAQAGFGSFRTFHQAFDVAGPINPIVSYRFDISHYQSAGFVQPNGSSDSLAISGALRFQITPDFVVDIRDDYGNIHPSDYEGTPTFNFQPISALRSTNFNVGDGTILFRQNYASVKETWTPNSGVTFVNDTYLIDQYRIYRECATLAFVPATNSVLRSMCRDIRGSQYQWGDHGYASLKYSLFGFDNETLLGFDLNHSNYARSDNQSGVGSSTGSSSVNAFSFAQGTFSSTGATAATPQYVLNLHQSGVFLENRFKILDNLALVAGVRGDHYDTDLLTFPSSLRYSGRYNGPGYNVGLIYNPIPNIALYGRYSVATDPVTSLASASATTIQFGLSPARQFEVGAKGSFLDNRLETTLALYKIVKNNLLTPSPANPAVMDTVGQQSSQGIEGSVAYRVLDNLKVEANGTILQAKFDNYLASVSGKTTNLAGLRPQFVPTRTANVLASWVFFPDWEMRGALRFVGDRFSDNTDLYKMPAYTVLDLGLKWNVTKNVSVDFRVSNVTNTTYIVSTYAGNGTQAILGEPRAFVGTLNAQF